MNLTTIDQEQTMPFNNFQAHILPSKKFKTITVEMKLKTLLERESITKRTILPFVLRKGSHKYPTAADIQDKLDDMYGASLEIIGQKAGSYHVLSFQMEFPNQKFIADEHSVLTDAMAFLREVAFHPNVTDEQFDPDITEREKETIRRHLQSLKDEKMGYANLRLVDEMAEGERYQIRPYGYEADIDAIDAANLYTYYKQIVNEDQIDLFIVGDVDSEEMTTILSTELDGFRTRSHAETIQPEIDPVQTLSHADPNVVVEEDSIQQAKLHMGYRTNTAYKDDDFAGMLLAETILGAHPGSKLFLNVREKHSLAYYAASGLDHFSDKMFLFSGIAPEDYERTRTIMEEQVDALKEGHISEREIEEAKSVIIHEMRTSLDHAGGMIDLSYQQELGNRKRSMETLFREVRELTKEDVVRSANKLQLDTVFLLTGKEGK